MLHLLTDEREESVSVERLLIGFDNLIGSKRSPTTLHPEYDRLEKG